MTIPNREQRIQSFKEGQKKQGGIVLSKLTHGQEVFVDTEAYEYHFTVHHPPKRAPRFYLETGAPSCFRNKVCTHISSHHGTLKFEISDWIGRDMNLILKFTNGASVVTGQVQGAEVCGYDRYNKKYRINVWD